MSLQAGQCFLVFLKIICFHFVQQYSGLCNSILKHSTCVQAERGKLGVF